MALKDAPGEILTVPSGIRYRLLVHRAVSTIRAHGIIGRALMCQSLGHIGKLNISQQNGEFRCRYVNGKRGGGGNGGSEFLRGKAVSEAKILFISLYRQNIRRQIAQGTLSKSLSYIFKRKRLPRNPTYRQLPIYTSPQPAPSYTAHHTRAPATPSSPHPSPQPPTPPPTTTPPRTHSPH